MFTCTLRTPREWIGDDRVIYACFTDDLQTGESSKIRISTREIKMFLFLVLALVLILCMFTLGFFFFCACACSCVHSYSYFASVSQSSVNLCSAVLSFLHCIVL